MSDYNLGTARGTIQIDYNGVGAKKAKSDMDQLGKSGIGTDAALSKVARGTGVVGLVIAAGFGVAANAAANFEQRLSGIEAVSGATGKEMDQIRAKALQLGKDTKFSAGESAQAMEELIKAGLPVKDVLNGAADATVALAAAGEIDLPQAATIASNAMNQFGLAAKDMPKVADAIAGAANASAIDVGEFGQSLSQVGAVANLAGLSFEDTAIAIAEMGNAGIKGSDAGTSLKSMLSRLQPTTQAAADTFKKLGIIAEDGTNKFYDQEGRLKSLSDIQGILNGSLKDMTAQQKQAALQTLFGSDAIRAAAILANEGSEGYDKMSASMGKVTAADVAAKRMDNLKGSVEQLKGSAETLGIVLGTILIPFIRDMVEVATSILNKFLELDDGTQKLIVSAVGLVGGFLLATAALIKIVQFARAARAAYAALRLAIIATSVAASAQAGFAALSAGLVGSATGATLFTRILNILGRGLRVVAIAVKAFTVSLLTNPIFLIIAAIIGLVALLVLLYKKNETVRKVIDKAWAAIKTAISAVVDWITGTMVPAFVAAFDAVAGAVGAVVGFIRDHWRLIIAILLGPFGIIIALVTKYFSQIKGIISGAINGILAVWKSVWGMFGPLVMAVFNFIVAAVRLGIALVQLAIYLAVTAIKAVWNLFWNGLKTVVSAVWGAIVGVVRTYVNIVKAIITAVFNAIKAVVTAIWNGIKSVTTSVWNAIKNAVAGPINAVKPIVMRAVNAVKGAISAAWNAVRSVTSSVWNGLRGIVGGAISNVIGKVKEIKGKVTGALSGAASWLYNSGKKIVQGLIDGIVSMIGKATAGMKKVTSAIGKFVPGSPVKEGDLKKINKGRAGGMIVQMLADGILNNADVLVDAMRVATNLPIGAEINPMMKGAIDAAVNVPSLDLSAASSLDLQKAMSAQAEKQKQQRLEGMLTLTPESKAFIKGVTTEVDESNTNFEAVMDRMDKK